jgi:ketosteroid isomerase-like protein
VRTKAPPQRLLAGKYVVVWEKVRGNWKLATDIANFDTEG